jgi:nicotinate-nucleotide pyrophosphorylase (carboxylating)
MQNDLVNTGVAPLPALLIEPVVRAALAEDLGRAGDITTDAVIAADAAARTVIAARQPGRVAGLDLALMAWRLLDPAIEVEIVRGDGSDVTPGDIVARIAGPARALLTGERVALNFLCRLSGIASATAAIVDSVRGHHARITCTRKTTPGLRVLEKYAVRTGGGVNHRFGLDDGILIKDNHIAIAGGIGPAVERARRNIGHMVKIEVEVDTLDQLREALALGVEAVLLDNMNPQTLRKAVGLIDGRAIAEASGRVSRETAPAIAASGVDLISVGWLTHSAPTLDLGLDFEAAAWNRAKSNNLRKAE